MKNLKEISVEITNECSMNCIHCSSKAGKKFNNELSLDEIISIINQTKSLGGYIFTLSGGDPILRADLFDIIRYARSSDFEIRLQTSGVYDFGNGEIVPISESQLDLFLENMNPNDKLVYSILGLQSTHDRITSINGSYDLAMESIRRTKNRGINVEVHTVPNKINYKEIPQLADILEANKIDIWHLLRLVPQGRVIDHPELEFTKKQFKKLQEILIFLSKRNSKMKLKLGHNIDRRYWSDSSYSATQCKIGEDKMLIRANGDITYCAALKYDNFGNIRDHSLAYFWNDHPFVKEVRLFLNSDFRKVKGKCSSCDILTDCLSGCVAQRLYTHGELKKGPDPLCYRNPIKRSQSLRHSIS